MSRQLTMAQLAALMEAGAKEVNPAVDKKLQLLGQVGVGYMKEEIQSMHAVDTGTMLNSVSAESEGLHAILIGPTVFYAPYVALGTSRMEARPFHIAAARRLDQDIKSDFITTEDLGL
jgi:hypothetical protein